MSVRVLFVASECAPYRRSGGLGEVVGALPRALRQLGVDARVVMPLHAGFPWEGLDRLDGALAVPTGYGPRRAAVRMSPRDALVPVYFIEHRGFFDRPQLYGPPGGAYSDNLERFSFFAHAALALAEAIAFSPDVWHAHDWQTALVPLYLEGHRAFRAAASVFTIHNLAHQGVFDLAQLGRLALLPQQVAAVEQFGALNLMKGALERAGRLTTVSPSYAREIRDPAHGMGLDGVLRARGAEFSGILNGIDCDEWDPRSDPHLARHYHRDDLAGKAVCKEALQREAGLAVGGERPLFGFVGRLAAQKGVDLLLAALERALHLELQCVLLGDGEPALEAGLRGLGERYPGRCRSWLGFDEARAHRIHAGADFFLMPSRFEPCGLDQMHALRYGTLPIVHRTGGLRDTVENYDARQDRGVGFTIDDLSADSLRDALGWALATWYQDRPAIERLRRRAMALDVSWPRRAREYLALYQAAAG